MPRIGFAYNQKPESTAIARPDDETPRGDDEPPSSRRDAIASRNSDAPASTELTHSVTVGGNFAAPALLRSAADDEFAEWDSAETIDAVANALSALGEVIRLEANADFPQSAPRRATRHRLQHRRRTERRESRSTRPRDLRVLRHPVLGERPVHALALPRQGEDERDARLSRRADGRIQRRDVAGSGSRKRTVERDVDATARAARYPPCRCPLFAKPIHEGSSKGITEANFCRTQRRARSAGRVSPRDATASRCSSRSICPAPSSPAQCSATATTRSVLPIVGMNFDALPEGALPVYGFEAKWIWDRPEKPSRDVRLSRADH